MGDRMIWKGIRRKTWEFEQAFAAENSVYISNPARGWYGVYTFRAEERIAPEELKWSLREGELREKLQFKINKLGLKDDFILMGARENPFPYYKECDLYVHASRFEGKSIAIQEAQTLGCTLVVSDCSGNREQVEPGVDGMMCRLDAKEICDTVEALLKDEEKCRKLGKKAAEKSFLEDKDVLKPFDF